MKTADPDIVQRATRTLMRITNAALATVSPEGYPWNSPLFVAFDRNLTFYWSSHLDAVHSVNVAANPAVFLVVFDSTTPDQSGHAVYLRGLARELVDESAIRTALECLARRRNEPPKPPGDFMPPHRRRVYAAIPDVIWTNIVTEEHGHHSDKRVIVDLRRASTASPCASLDDREAR